MTSQIDLYLLHMIFHILCCFQILSKNLRKLFPTADPVSYTHLALIEEKLADYPDLKGTKAAFCWISADDLSSFYIYMPSDPRASYLLDLGLEFPESVKELAENTSDFSITVSRENADQLKDVDMIVVYGDQSLLDALQEDELMSQIPAVKNGAVALIDSTSALAGASTPSILSIPYEIDEYLSLLSEAQEQIQ